MTPMKFVRDLKAFPRADEHAPDWLRETVERGLELQRAHEASVADQHSEADMRSGWSSDWSR